MKTKKVALLQRPLRILLSILALVFAAEVAVMLALPYLMPDFLAEARVLGQTGQAVFDAVLLTVVCAPALWWLIIGPLRRIAMEAHERSETVVANACDGILTVDRDGIIVSCNQAGQRLLGTPGEQMIGAPIRRFIADWPTQFPALPAQIEREAARPGARRVPLEISVSEFLTSIPGKLIVIVRDLTSTKQAEQERLELVRRAEALRTQQMSTLAQLATGVAHEIRNPLTAIKMLIQVNRRNLGEAGLPTDDLELVETEIRRMERSIHSLLDYARPEKGELRQLVLQHSVERVLQLIHGQRESQRVTISVDMPTEPVILHGDAAQIHQLLLNLLLNSLDAMNDGGNLRIVMKTEGERVELNVMDSGAGIRRDVMDRIFDPFVTTKSHGIGLGLGICRRIAEAHGGKLEGFNANEGGAVFRLTLPAIRDAVEPCDGKSMLLSAEATCKSC